VFYEGETGEQVLSDILQKRFRNSFSSCRDVSPRSGGKEELSGWTES